MVTPRRKYKAEDNVKLQKELAIAIRAALENYLGLSHTKVISSTLTHTDLQPEGNMFTINFLVETHDKPEEKAVCDECGQKDITGRFCPNCGAKRK